MSTWVKGLSLVGVMTDISRGAKALDGEGSVKSEWRGGNVVVAGGPLTREFDEAPLEEGRGRSKSEGGRISMSGGSGECIDLVVSS